MSDLELPEYPKPPFWRVNNPLAYGVIVTILVLAAYVILGFQTECIATQCETKFRKFWEADPNEVGDTLSGLFGALAFIWIIVTVLLQSQELREQRKEFREQRRATRDIADETKLQRELLRLESRRQQEQHAANQFDELVDLVENCMRDPVWEKIKWICTDRVTGRPDNSYELTTVKFAPWTQERNEDEPWIDLLFRRSMLVATSMNFEVMDDSVLPVRRGEFARLLEALRSLCELETKLPKVKLVDFKAWKLKSALANFENINQDAYWHPMSRSIV